MHHSLFIYDPLLRVRMGMCQGSIAVSSAALHHRINPFDCLAASSLPMRPLSPFWSPHLLSASFNSELPPCEIVSFPLWKSLTMETFMLKTRHLRRKKSNWLSSIQTARTNPRTRYLIVKSLTKMAMFSSKPAPRNCSFHLKYWHSLLLSLKQCLTKSFSRGVTFEACKIRLNFRCHSTKFLLNLTGLETSSKMQNGTRFSSLQYTSQPFYCIQQDLPSNLNHVTGASSTLPLVNVQTHCFTVVRRRIKL